MCTWLRMLCSVLVKDGASDKLHRQLKCIYLRVGCVFVCVILQCISIYRFLFIVINIPGLPIEFFC